MSWASFKTFYEPQNVTVVVEIRKVMVGTKTSMIRKSNYHSTMESVTYSVSMTYEMTLNLCNFSLNLHIA